MMESSDFGLAVVGCGRWGINHVRTAYQLFKDKLILVSDSDPSAAQKVRSVSPDIKFTRDLDDVVSDERINAVIVATPAETHFMVASDLLRNGKNVLVEKPVTLCSDEARELLRLAEDMNLKLMVGHILLYHPAILKTKQMLDEGRIGALQYIYSNRLNLGSIRSEENILWSFAPHDISVMQFLTGSNPISIRAMGASFLQSKIEDVTMTHFIYPDNIHAHIFVSWLHPFKEQRLVIVGDRGMIVFEDTAPTEKLRFYPKGFRRNGGLLEKFDGDYEVVKFEAKKPLAEEQLHFADCIKTGASPLTNGEHALEVLQILEQAAKELEVNELA